jgi:hypothetical protein
MSESDGLEVLTGQIGPLPQRALIDATLPAEYRDLYQRLVNQAFGEMPEVAGYQTMHGILVERLSYFFCRQKMMDNRHVGDVDWKAYRIEFNAMMKTIEALLKQMRAISITKAFKTTFVAEVMQIINRNVSNPVEKRAIGKELIALANAQKK